MTTPRATSSEADELGALLAGLQSRLNELETVSGSGNVPVGTIVDFVGVSAPRQWTILDGGTITNGRFLYPSLWLLLPSTFKSGNNIVKPDTRGKVTVHRAASGTLNVAVGSTGGAETVTLTTSQIPSHAHGMDHIHRVASRSFNVSSGAGGTTLSVNGTAANTYSDGPIDSGLASKTSTDNAGGSSSHTNLQPYMITVKILKLV
jgi:microcystin-dependent protein